MTQKPQAAGGHAKARKIRAAYLASPKLCNHCKQPIVPQPGQILSYVRTKKYCTRSCAAMVNNKHAPSRQRKLRLCKFCGKHFIPDTKTTGSTVRCPECRQQFLQQTQSKPKGECSTGLISGHARNVTRNWPRACRLCGYDKFVETCHIKAVHKFPPHATLGEMNDPSNLVLLCPNCHWEFDHGLLDQDALFGLSAQAS